MTHTALTAEEEIRPIRGLATARKEHRVFEEDHRETPMFWEHHWESPAWRGAEEALACRNVLTSAPLRPGPACRPGAPPRPTAGPRHHWPRVLRNCPLCRQVTPVAIRGDF